MGWKKIKPFDENILCLIHKGSGYDRIRKTISQIFQFLFLTESHQTPGDWNWQADIDSSGDQ